jgi:hypothetical protein
LTCIGSGGTEIWSRESGLFSSFDAQPLRLHNDRIVFFGQDATQMDSPDAPTIVTAWGFDGQELWRITAPEEDEPQPDPAADAGDLACICMRGGPGAGILVPALWYDSAGRLIRSYVALSSQPILADWQLYYHGARDALGRSWYSTASRLLRLDEYGDVAWEVESLDPGTEAGRPAACFYGDGGVLATQAGEPLVIDLIAYDVYELARFSSDGSELWRCVLPAGQSQAWAGPDGGSYAAVQWPDGVRDTYLLLRLDEAGNESARIQSDGGAWISNSIAPR